MIRVSQMFLLRKPGEGRVSELVRSQREAGFSYAEPGATREGMMPGYRRKQERFELGRGAGAFARAREAVRQWRMFDVGWIELCGQRAPIDAGSTVAVVVRHFGFWSVNISRIVYAIDEPRCYGFAYGTLPEHAETGEERFLVDWEDDDSVWYEVLALSRERHVVAKLAFPLSRMLQARFRRDSGRAMRRAVGA